MSNQHYRPEVFLEGVPGSQSQTLKVALPYQWEPREYQDASWNYLTEGGLRCVDNWHRRSGKDEKSLRHSSRAMSKRIGNYWYLLPEAEQGRKTMWQAINPHTQRYRLEETFPRSIRKRTNQQQMMITLFNDSTFQLVGADNFHSLVGSPPVGLVFSEYARTDPSSWAYLMPILEENGGWAIFNSTPYGDNHFKTICEMAKKLEAWHYDEQTADQTGVFSPAQLQNIRMELEAQYGTEYGYALFLQEYYCSFDAAIPGSIYGEFLRTAEEEGRILDYVIDLNRPVYTAWDIGRTDNTAIWWYQVVGRELLVFDFYNNVLKDVDFYVDILREKQDAHQFTYAINWLPHDARPRRFGMGAGSILQQFEHYARLDRQLGQFSIVPHLDVQEGIQAARKTLKVTRFHATNCKEGLRGLKHYHRQWDEKTGKFLDHPHHDWASDYADAFRYLSLSWRYHKPTIRELLEVEALEDPIIKPVTYGSLKKAHLARKKSARLWSYI